MNYRLTSAACAALFLLSAPVSAQDAIGGLIQQSAPQQLPGGARHSGTAVPLQQPLTAPAEEEVTVVDALVVTAVRPGPAFWKVADADSTVWVLGVPDGLPDGVEWKKDELRAHIRGANVLINGSAGPTWNPATIVRLLFTMSRFRGEQPLDKVIRPDLYARYNAALQSLRRGDSERMNEIRPGYAAFFLSAIFQSGLDMDSREPVEAITDAARFRVRTENVGRSAVIDVLRLIEAMPVPMAETCMEDAIEQVEAGKERMLEAARGWARGDLRVALSAERGFDRCIGGYPEIRAQNERENTEVTAAIVKALEKPGKSVAVAGLQPLLAPNGILVRLMATPGVTVTTPDVPGLENEIGYEPAEQ